MKGGFEMPPKVLINKRSLLFFAITLLIFTNCHWSLSSYEGPWQDKKRQHLLDYADGVATYMEGEKLGNGIYPTIIDGGNIAGLFQEFKKEIFFESTGETYKLLLITNYKVKGCNKYTVIKIIDSSIYWRDNFARDYDLIDDIEWEKVNHLVVNLKRNENGEWIYNQPIDFPRYIR